jgi:hypothetical protein
MDNPIVASTRHLDAPWIAANLAVLNEAAVDVRVDVDFQVLAAKRTRDQELVWHSRQSYCNAGQPATYRTCHVGRRVLGEVPHCFLGLVRLTFFGREKRERLPGSSRRHQMRTFLRTMIFGTALAALGVHVAAQTADPLIGTWELNIAKSKYDPGPAPKSETRTYVVVGQDIKATSKGVDADGKPTSRQLTLNYDGKDRPATGSLDLDALSLKRIDAFTAEFTLKKTGKVVATGTRAISKDGKVMTIATKGTNAKGQAFNDVQVFDKR